MIVWLGSYPRSGNTMFRMLLHSIYGIYTYSAQDDPALFRHGVADVIGHKRLPDAKVALLRLNDYEQEPWFIKTHGHGDHIPPNHLTIHVVRDGRAAVTSQAARQVDQRGIKWHKALWDLVSANGDWGNFVLSWRARDPRTTTHVRYEDMLDDPIETVTAAVEYLGLDLKPLDKITIPTFEQLHTAYPTFFRRGKKASWQEEMPEKFENVFWHNHARGMEAFGYER